MSVELKKVDVVCVDGQSLAEGWMVTPVKKGGVLMLDLFKSNYKFKKFVHNDLTMFEHLRRLRNKKVEDEMKKRCNEVELADDDVPAARLPKRPKRQMIDEISDTVTVQVVLEDDSVVEVVVGSDFSSVASLLIEYTQTNMELLLKKPKLVEEDTASSFVPEIKEVNVGRVSSLKAVYCRYWDKDSRRYKRKTMGIKLKGDAAAMQEQVDKYARVVQPFYNVHHTEPDEDAESEES